VVTKIKQKLIVNPADTEHFRLLLPRIPSTPFLPDFVADSRSDQDNTELFSIVTRSASLPSVANEELKLKIPYGEASGFQYSLTLGSFSINCKVGSDFYIYNMFLLWMFMKKWPKEFGGLIDHNKYREAVHVDGTLVALDGHNAKVAEWTFYGLHPISLSAINFSYITPGTTIYMDVEFGYHYFLPTDEYEIDDSLITHL